MFEKVDTIKRFKYSLLGSDLTKQTDIAEKQHKRFDNTNEFDKIIKKEKPTVKKYNRSNLIYNSKHKFYEHCNIKKLNNPSLESKYPSLPSFYNE